MTQKPSFEDLSRKVKMLEKEIRELSSQKKKAELNLLKDIAGGMAHRFNNLLMGIQGNISLLKFDIKSDHPHQEIIRQTEKYIQIGTIFTDHLLNFSAHEKTAVKLTEVNALIDETFHLMDQRTDEAKSDLKNQPLAEAITIGPVDIIEVYEELSTHQKTVLLIDDDDMMRNVGKKMLEKMKLCVITASGGKEALEIFRSKKNDIDLVILDLVMQDMDGGETFDHLRKLNSDIKVILATGYGGKAAVKAIMKRGCDGFIKKPFKVEELVVKMREVLALEIK